MIIEPPPWLWLVNVAADKLQELLEHPDPNVRLNACVAVLTLARLGEADLADERLN